MNTNNLIDYFNEVSNEIFEVLSEIKYSIRLLEINQENRFIGFSIDTEYFAAQITVLTPDNHRYILNRSCSMQLYSFDDSNLDLVLYESTFRSIEECIIFLVDKDVANLINMPKYHLN
jgi:hypothetical protein